MQKLFIWILLVAISSPAAADESWRRICSSMGTFAETVMEKRQKGVAMAKLMGIITETEAKDMAENIIVMAYDEPRYVTAPTQQRTIEDFRDKIYLACVKEMRPNN